MADHQHRNDDIRDECAAVHQVLGRHYCVADTGVYCQSEFILSHSDMRHSDIDSTSHNSRVCATRDDILNLALYHFSILRDALLRYFYALSLLTDLYIILNFVTNFPVVELISRSVKLNLENASSHKLIVRRSGLTTAGDRAFWVAAPCLWNDLPAHVISAPSLSVFKNA